MRCRPTPDARHNQVDGPFLHTLMQASPSAERIVLYAQMVVEASIHRTVALHAARIRAAADTDGAGDVVAERIATTNDEALGMLDAVEKRWAGIGEDPVIPETPEPERARHSAQPVPAEAAVVASLLDDPAQIDELSRWLTPDDFSHPALRAVYAAALTVRARGEPADPVTVMWECHRHGAFTHRRFGADDLARLSRQGVPGYAISAGRDVLLVSLRGIASDTADKVARAAMRPELTPSALVQTTRPRLERVAQVGNRWRQATTPAVSAGL